MEYKFLSTIDNSGRFVIPKRLLKELGWQNIPKVNVVVKDDEVIITKADEYIQVCHKCRKEVKDDFRYCPYCGVKQNER